MENDVKVKNRKPFAIVLFLLGIVLIGLGIFTIVNTPKSIDDKEEIPIVDNNPDQTEDNTYLDYEKLEDEFIALVDKDENIDPYLSTCKQNKDDFEVSSKVLSIDSIVEVIDKLKKASKVEEKVIEGTCPEYSYSISSNVEDDNKRSDELFITYGTDKKSLLVGIKDKGYEFTYNSTLDNFLENLK